MNSRTLGASSAVLVLVALGLGSAGCLDRDLKPLTPCTVSGVVQKVRQNAVDKVDVLFLVDNSNSMAEEQASLTIQFPHLVSVLATGDRDGDGTPEFPAVKDLHVGVVSSDMGNGGYPVPTCATTFGDDGILITRGNTATAGCMATYPPYLAFMPPGDVMQFATDFACVARLGTGGCGFEQHLESVLKAVTPSTSGITFNMGTVGHADRENAGFLRDDSVIAIVVVGDEDDCSALDPDLFNPSSTTYTGDLNLRCFMYPAAVQPVGRYVDGFRALRPDNPDLFVFADIGGVPTDLVANPDAIDYNAILADSRMQETVDTTAMSTRLTPSCNVPGRGLAFPPRRMVTVAQQFAPNAVVQSICQDDFGPALDAIIKKIADVLGKVCLPRALNPDATGRVGCEVVEVLPSTGDFTRCDQVAGRTFTRMSDPGLGEPEGHEVCTVDQVPGGAGAGWYYDNGTEAIMRCPATTPQRIAFTAGAEPPAGTDVRLECLQPVQTLPGSAAGAVTLGTVCRGMPAGFCEGSAAVRGLFCDDTSSTCQLGCSSDADCVGAGLSGFVCDVGLVTMVSSSAVCVNPTCGR